MKKAISLIMAVIIAATCFTAGSFAIKDGDELTDYPVIIVAGYSSSDLVRINDDGSEEQIWHLEGGNILDMVTGYIGRIIAGLGMAVLEKPDYLAKIVGEGGQQLLEGMRCNDDGTSTYNVRPMFMSAHETNSEVMYQRFGDYSHQHETDIMGMVRDYIGRENTYNFNCDFRMGAVACAKRLDEYIDDVRRDSGKDKVNILAVSHGGQVSATYLTLYGSKRAVNNCVMTVPAIGGAGILYDLLGENTKFDELNLLYFIEHGMKWENDYHWLVEAQQLGFLDSLITALLPYFFEIIGNWGSIWDFVPTDAYEECKAKWLDPVANKELIAKSDYMHYTVMPQFWTALDKCNTEYGMHVSIIAGTDNGITTGAKVNSDGIIPTASSTGGYCAPFGERFADGYVQKNDCGGKYKVNPAMTVDLSCGYMPDNTWLVSGLFHGMTFWDYYSRELMMELLLTDNIRDVYSSSEYTQFHLSTNPSYAVSAWFDKSDEGFLGTEDGKLILRNLSITGKPVRILGITCDGADLSFKLRPLTFIKAGEEISIPFTGEIPQQSAKRITLVISYNVYGSLTPVGERKIPITVMNGDKAQSGGEFDSLFGADNLEKLIGARFADMLRKLGLYAFFSMIYNIVYAGVSSARALIAR